VQLTSLHTCKRAEVLLNALDEFGDAALQIVAPRVANEKVVGHCLIQRLRGYIVPLGQLSNFGNTSRCKALRSCFKLPELRVDKDGNERSAAELQLIVPGRASR